MSSPIVLTMFVPATEVIISAYEVTGVVTEQQPYVGELTLELAGELQVELHVGEVIPEEEP